MYHSQPKLFIDSQLKHPIYDLSLSFSDYISACKQLISQQRLDLTVDSAEKIIHANAPFELRPDGQAKCGALLIHGLLDSPFTMQDIGLQLQAQGVLTRAILLPGHGTVPGDLLQVKYQDWCDAVRYGIATFAKEVDQLYLIGYSTGASLALYHCLTQSDPIAGVVMLAPALKINSAFLGLVNAHKALSWAWPRAAWLHQDPRETLDYARYLSLTFNAVHQVNSLARAIKKEKACEVPLLVAIAEDDKTVCSNATLNYFDKQTHPRNHLILYSNEPEMKINPRITQRHASYIEKRILNFSHLALPISAANLHYGEYGDYEFASRILKDNTWYGEFSPGRIMGQALAYKFGWSAHRCERLTYNPDFGFLVRKIGEFLGTI